VRDDWTSWLYVVDVNKKQASQINCHGSPHTSIEAILVLSLEVSDAIAL